MENKSWLENHSIGKKMLDKDQFITVVVVEKIITHPAVIVASGMFVDEKSAISFINEQATSWNARNAKVAEECDGEWEVNGIGDEFPVFSSLLEECDLVANDGENQLLFAINEDALEAKKHRDEVGNYYLWGPNSKEYELVKFEE